MRGEEATGLGAGGVRCGPRGGGAAAGGGRGPGEGRSWQTGAGKFGSKGPVTLPALPPSRSHILTPAGQVRCELSPCLAVGP